MASGKIGFGEAFDSDFIKKMGALNKEFVKFLKTYEALIKESKDNKELIQAAKSLNEFNKAAKKGNDIGKKLTDTEKELARLKRLTVKNTVQASKAVRKESVEYQKSVIIKRQEVAEAKKLARAQLGLAKTSGRLFKSIAKGNIIANAFSRIIRGIGRAIGNTVRKIVDFDQAVANVGAIANATDEEMKQLSRTALKLGGSTKFTATEVAELQKELAKLGFTVSEITDAQEAILNLAAAANTDLARAAEVAGITVNQFGLMASDTAEVVDVMAKSFTTSALDVEKFAEAMKFVGPAARASGLSIQQATANIAQLADAGISGSMAGTSLRQIMLALSKESGTFTEKIERAAQGGLTLAGASQEVQKRAATALLVLADGVDTIDEYTRALEESAGAAEELARRQLDTLKGSITILTSAWDRFVISVSNSETGFRGIKSILNGFTVILNNYIDSTEALTEATDKQAKSFKDSFLSEIQDQSYAARVKSLSGEIEFIKKEINEYGHELSEANFQLANTKKREKETREEWEKRQGVAEGMLRTYRSYLILLEGIAFEEEEVTTETKAQIEARRKLNEAYAKSVELLRQIKPPKDLEQLNTEEFLKGLNLEDILIDSVSDTDLDNLDFSWFSDAFEDDGEEAIKTAEDIFKAIFKIGEAQRTREKAATDQAALERLATEESVINSINGLGIEGLNIFSNINKRKQNTLDNRLEQGLISENKYNTEINKLRKRQDALQKLQAIFSIGINTAVAAMQVAGQTGVGAVVAVPLVLALGALQIAAVLSEPMPQYAGGTDSSLAGPAIVGEKGRELKVDPSGKMSLTPGKPTLDYLKKGTKIVPADVTEQLLRFAAVSNGFEGKADDDTIFLMMDELKGIKRAIMSKPVTSSTITPGGILTATHKGNTTLIKRLKYYT